MQNYATISAERLKGLRTEAGLSPEKLSEDIEKECSVFISGDSLRKYESPAGSADSIPAGKIRAIAKYYGVSADYILGFDVPKTAEIEVKQLADYSGLSVVAINLLHSKKEEEFQSSAISALTCSFIEAVVTEAEIVTPLMGLIVASQTAKAYKPTKKSLFSEVETGSVLVPPGLAESYAIDLICKLFKETLQANISKRNISYFEEIRRGDYGKLTGTPE